MRRNFKIGVTRQLDLTLFIFGMGIINDLLRISVHNITPFHELIYNLFHILLSILPILHVLCASLIY